MTEHGVPAEVPQKPLHDHCRTFVVVLETGEELAASLQKFATRENVQAASFTAIGALSLGRLGLDHRRALASY